MSAGPVRLVAECGCGERGVVPIDARGDAAWRCGGCGRGWRVREPELGRLASRIRRAQRIAIAAPVAVAALVLAAAAVWGPGLLMMLPLGAGLAAVAVRYRYQSQVRAVYRDVAARRVRLAPVPDAA